jgi:hypothetical protein
MRLPDEIYSKILLYNIHNNAEILKQFIKEYNDEMVNYNFCEDFSGWYLTLYNYSDRKWSRRVKKPLFEEDFEDS